MNKLIKLTVLLGILLSSRGYGTVVEATTTTAHGSYLQQQEEHHAPTSRFIVEHLIRYHYRQFRLDQHFSNEVFNHYLCLLDPQHDLLLSSDLQPFAEVRQQLGKELTTGQLKTAYRLYNLVQQRRLERYRYALTLLDKPFSFDKEDTFESDRSKAAWPAQAQQRQQLWARRVKFDALNLRLAKKTCPEITEILTKRYQSALKHIMRGANSEDVFYAFMNAFTSEIDPHTRYLSPRHAAQFGAEMSLSLEGIGAGLQSVDDHTVVMSLMAGTPAANSKAIAVNDRIIGVGQPNKKMVEVIGWRLDDVVELIRGPAGSEVCLEILPAGNLAKSRYVVLKRARIRLADRAAKAAIRQVGQDKVGILTIPSFYIGLAEEVEKKLTQFEQQGTAAILIDLRGNGGGVLDEAVALTGLFIPKGPIVQIRNRQEKITINLETDRHRYYTGPVALLVNHLSASASEIFSAALQDYGRALIVGEQTFGKGTVQRHQPFGQKFLPFTPPSGCLQYTIQKFYRINGRSTQLKGITPDIILPPGGRPIESSETLSEKALPWDRIGAATYQAVGDLTPYFAKLREQHHRRVLASDAFAFVRQQLAYYHAGKQQGGVISLNFKRREKELKKQEAVLLALANQRRARQGSAPLKSFQELYKEDNPPDPHLEEALAITRDLLALQVASQCHHNTHLSPH